MFSSLIAARGWLDHVIAHPESDKPRVIVAGGGSAEFKANSPRRSMEAESEFHWYHVNGDGTADRFDDSPAICARIDAGERGWFGSPEGAIRHGGVIATAFEQTTEAVFDAAHWFETGEPELR